MLWVNFLSTNCQPDHSLICFLSPLLSHPLPPSLASPFNIPSVVLLYRGVSAVASVYGFHGDHGSLRVIEHDQPMKNEPGVTHFPGTDGVLTGCTTNQTSVWCLESRLGLTKNRKLWLGARIDLNRQDIQTQLDTPLTGTHGRVQSICYWHSYWFKKKKWMNEYRPLVGRCRWDTPALWTAPQSCSSWYQTPRIRRWWNLTTSLHLTAGAPLDGRSPSVWRWRKEKKKKMHTD